MPAVPARIHGGSVQSEALQVHLLGLVDYDAAIGLQRHLAREVSARNDRQGHLFLCEHPPGISIGRDGSRANLLCDDAEYQSWQMQTRWVSRGGGTWVHVPGQLAAYAVLPIDRLGSTPGGLRQTWLRALEGAVADQHVAAWRSTATVGLETRVGHVAFVGASLVDGVSEFGAVLNVATSPEALQLVRWGARVDRVTSLSAARYRPLEMGSVRTALIHRFATAAGYNTYHIFTGHPQLVRTRRMIYVFD